MSEQAGASYITQSRQIAASLSPADETVGGKASPAFVGMVVPSCRAASSEPVSFPEDGRPAGQLWHDRGRGELCDPGCEIDALAVDPDAAFSSERQTAARRTPKSTASSTLSRRGSAACQARTPASVASDLRRSWLLSGYMPPCGPVSVEQARNARQPQRDTRKRDAQQQPQDLQRHERIHRAVDVAHRHSGRYRASHIE